MYAVCCEFSDCKIKSLVICMQIFFFSICRMFHFCVTAEALPLLLQNCIDATILSEILQYGLTYTMQTWSHIYNAIRYEPSDVSGYLIRTSGCLIWHDLTTLLETVATTLALKDGYALDRLHILDRYNFLAVPGSSNPKLSTNTQKARYFNFRTVADIRMGLSKSSAFISMMEAAKATSSPPLTAVIILEQIEKLKISIGI